MEINLQKKQIEELEVAVSSEPKLNLHPIPTPTQLEKGVLLHPRTGSEKSRPSSSCTGAPSCSCTGAPSSSCTGGSHGHDPQVNAWGKLGFDRGISASPAGVSGYLYMRLVSGVALGIEIRVMVRISATFLTTASGTLGVGLGSGPGLGLGLR